MADLDLLLADLSTLRLRDLERDLDLERALLAGVGSTDLDLWKGLDLVGLLTSNTDRDLDSLELVCLLMCSPTDITDLDLASDSTEVERELLFNLCLDPYLG